MSESLRRSMKEARVLVVEDVQRLRDVLVAGIPSMGFQATGAPSAEAAIEIMERDAREIIIVDLNLPSTGGLDFLKQVRDRWPDTQGIVLTGFGDLKAAQRAIRLDIVDFLTKPASLGDLEMAIDRAYRRWRYADGNCSADATPEAETSGGVLGEFPRDLQDLEREHILAVLEHYKGNRATTAAKLGISRRTLFYRLAEYRRESVTPPTK